MVTGTVSPDPKASPGSRCPPPKSVSPSPPPAPPITRGATARSAASPRVSSLNGTTGHRMSLKATIPPHVANGDIQSLSASLKQETDQKEQLLVQIQNKEQTIAGLSTENDNLSSALSAAETRLNELYADQSRNEEEMAARIEVSDKLRAQVREMEKEKRDIQRRYNEQTATFDAERQAFYDNEQHLKSRIQSLTQARKRPEVSSPVVEYESEAEPEDEVIQSPARDSRSPQQDITDPETEPAEMTSLKLELSTLSTSYASIQSTLVLLQSQLVDLKRVNHQLQEENESYMILLREKTLSGQFDVMRQVGGRGSSEEGGDDEDDGEDGEADSGDVGSLKSIGRSTLDRVEEMPEENQELELERSLEPCDTDIPSSMRPSRHTARQGRKRGTSISYSSGGSPPRGESLADLPITGPGLDLAAELGRAENKDIFSDGNTIEDRDRLLLSSKGKKVKKEGRKVSSSGLGHVFEPSGPPSDIDALRTEVKSLKDANKALSLYASKIIDRIISQEGFEHVLAVDYDKEPTGEKKSPPPKPPKSRPQSLFIGRSTSNPAPVDSPRFGTPPLTAKPNSTGLTKKANRRSLSFDWTSFSMFGGDKKPEKPNLRPLTLQPGNSPLTSARKLETQEDDEDRRERERLNATMKLMGIQPREPSLSLSTSIPMQKSYSSPAESQPISNRRYSFFGTKSTMENSDTSSVHSVPSLYGLGIDTPSGLTQEALEQVEAENSLAALDAHERVLSLEIAQGNSGRFTEMSPRVGSLGRRSRRSIGSGSIVWSAGSKSGDE